jgi:hypothetical protein
MMLGHAAGAAASIAVDQKVTVQNVPYPALRQRLLDEKQVLERKPAVAEANAPKEKRADSTPPAVQLAADMKVLVEKKVVDSADYWLAHARKGSSCDGEKVAELFVKMAKAFENGRGIDHASEAIPLLMEKRLFSSRDYWIPRAAPGGKCSGDLVAGIIKRFAATVKTSK